MKRAGAICRRSAAAQTARSCAPASGEKAVPVVMDTGRCGVGQSARWPGCFSPRIERGVGGGLVGKLETPLGIRAASSAHCGEGLWIGGECEERTGERRGIADFRDDATGRPIRDRIGHPADVEGERWSATTQRLEESVGKIIFERRQGEQIGRRVGSGAMARAHRYARSRASECAARETLSRHRADRTRRT